MTVMEIQRWLSTLEPESLVAVGEDVLGLVQLNPDNPLELSGAYLEIGGEPIAEDVEEETL